MVGVEGVSSGTGLGFGEGRGDEAEEREAAWSRLGGIWPLGG